MPEYEWELDMSNIADSTEYKDGLRRRIDDVKKHCGEPKKTEKSLDGYTLRCSSFSAAENNIGYSCCEYTLMKGDELLYSYEAIGASRINEIIGINGTDYFFHACGLYGYNVYNIKTGNCFQYFPKASENYVVTGNEKFKETFIWTDIHYNEKNGILAAGGCYWACPYRVLLYEMPDPEKEFLRIADPYAFIGGDNVYIEDIDFVRWDGTDLVLKCSISYDDGDTFEDKEIIISEEKYMSEMYEP